MTPKIINATFKITLILSGVLIYSCASEPTTGGGYDYKKQFPYRNNTVMSMDAAPREGWATDPHLSYDLFSYYPIDMGNRGIYGTMGLYGITYP